MKRGALTILIIMFFMMTWNTVQYNRVLYSPQILIVGSDASNLGLAEKSKLPAGVAIVDALAQMLERASELWTPNALPISPTWIMDSPQNYQLGMRETLREMMNALSRSIARQGASARADKRVELAFAAVSNDPTSFMMPAYGDKLAEAAQLLRSYESDLRSGRVRAFPTGAALKEIAQQMLSRFADEAGQLSRAPRFQGALYLSTDTAGDQTLSGERTINAAEYQLPWLQIDDAFYHAQGSAYVLHQVMRAVLVDFREVIESMRADELGKQVVLVMIPEYYETSPWIVMNDAPLGFFANHCIALKSMLLEVRSLLLNFQNAVTK